jgi:NapC/NirT cytochrome c family protein
MRAKRKRPLVQRLALWFIIAFLVAIPAGFGFMEYSTQPEFCASCHNMVPYVKSWQASSHGRANVGCIDCHFEPGALETLQGKFKASTQLVKYVTSTEGSKPWAQVSDNSCMRGGCHSSRLLEGKVEFKLGRTSIPFDHGPHLTEMRRNKKLRCTSCHSQIVQGEHLTVTTSTCLLCHFKGAEEDPKLSHCTTCHQPPKEPISVEGGFSFVHADYVKRGVACDSCHSGVTQGTGEVPKHRCEACHAVQEHIDRYGDTEFLHRKHVTDHKVDCLECHTEMTHKLRPQQNVGKGGCGQCHEQGHGVAESFYRGEGGRNVPATPNPMFSTRVGCAGCHRHFAVGDGVSAKTVPATETACIACHGPAYDGILGRWQETFGGAAKTVADEVAAALDAAQKAGPEKSAVAAKLVDAKHDAGLVLADGSRGAHNPWFARKLLEAAHDATQDAWAVLDPARPRAASPLASPIPTKLECTLVCHVGIEKRKITLPGTRFDHTAHLLKSGRECSECHSSGTHGRTLVTKDDCVTCHHNPKAPVKRDCASCHEEQDRLLKGLEADGSQGSQMMAKIGCAECHGDAFRMPGDPHPVPIREIVQKNCDRCHGEKYAGTVAEWTADSDAWFKEADQRLGKIRAKGASGAAAEKLAAAQAIVERFRRARPAHNVLAFEEAKEAFDEAASAAEK